jgi:hypothetical protein
MRFIALLGLLAAVANAQRVQARCFSAAPFGSWELSARDSRGGRIKAIVSFGDSTRLKGTEYHAEAGFNEPLDFALDSISWKPESVRFTFAPSAFHVRATCIKTDSLSVHISQVYLGKPIDPYIGYLRRIRKK